MEEITIKEKAKKLVENFYDESFWTQEEMYRKGKENAIICVDEIIEACEYNCVEKWNTDWWNKVKNEIKLL